MFFCNDYFITTNEQPMLMDNAVDANKKNSKKRRKLLWCIQLHNLLYPSLIVHRPDRLPQDFLRVAKIHCYVVPRPVRYPLLIKDPYPNYIFCMLITCRERVKHRSGLRISSITRVKLRFLIFNFRYSFSPSSCILYILSSYILWVCI